MGGTSIYRMGYKGLYNNQINARALISQSAIVCQQTHGKIVRLLNYYIKQ